MRQALALLLIGWCLPFTVLADCSPPGDGRLAIIIDDLGYNLSRGQQIAELPAPITLAIIPGTPHARALSEHGQRWGKEIIVHMPMTSAHEQVSDPLVLTANLTDSSFDVLITSALNDVPGATGMNNHMGSALTENTDAMRRFMTFLSAHDMFFIDSRTTAGTVAADIAAELGVPNASRSIFLDNDRDRLQIENKLKRAIELAELTGSAIAIGHPYGETLDVLRDALPRMTERVTLTPASEIARCETSQRLTSIPSDAK